MTILGIDLLGLGSKHWSVKETIAALPKGSAIGFFDNTFGDVSKNLIRVLKSGKVVAARVQIWWSYQHKIVPIDFLKKRVVFYEELAKRFPSIKFYISHSCEYSEKSIEEIRKRVEVVASLAPSCIPVQTPMHSPTIPGYIVEEHGPKAKVKKGGIASADGKALFDIDANLWAKQNSKAEILFSWGPRCNLAEAHNKKPPKERSAYPDAKYLKSLLRVMGSKGSAPKPVFGPVESITKPLLFKTHAEDLPGPNLRDNRPLVILRDKTPFVEVVAANGKVLGKLVYFGEFPPNLHRYYSGWPGGLGLYGYEIADKAKKISGSEWVWIKQGNRYFGPVNPIFREGFYQQ